ncbi:MAG TPA: NAD(P)-dependent oxidoreductase [Verrucomicrobiae bacterium]|jgi:UDP-glucose 4-epimerase|nr:NAD(P)-dependent oxidoreductase [Verrucomicrobiae bacterium]
MNVLITGAGLIGCHFAKRAAEAGNRVVIYDLSPNREYIDKIVGRERAEIVAADMRDLPALLSALGRFEIDTVVATAGLIGKRVAENSYTGSTNNILATIHTLEAARLRRLRRVVYVSTFGVYDREKIKAPIREDAPIGGHNLYTTTKACSEHLLHAYTHLYDLDTVIIRPAGVFGRGHYVGGSTVGMVMRDFALKLIKGGPVEIDAKIYFSNEYVYAKDVALAIDLACAVNAPKQRIYNAGSGVVTKAEDLAKAARELLPKLEVTVTGAAAESHAEYPLDLSASKAELGYTPQFPLKKALQDYMEELWSEGIRG